MNQAIQYNSLVLNILCDTYILMSIIMVVYREPITGPRSPEIVNWHPSINNKLANKPTPKPNHNPTLTYPNLPLFLPNPNPNPSPNP